MKLEHNVKLSPQQVAEAFCELTDDEMALVFEEIGRRADLWMNNGATMQWFVVGRHMRECACVTALGRSVIDEIHDSLHYEAEVLK